MIEFLAANKGVISSVFGFLIIAISSNQIARLFQKINLPLITGMIFVGIVSGPYLLGLIPEQAKRDLHFINEIALAFIAFAAGSELYIRELRSRFRSIKWNTFGQLIVTFVFGSLTLFLLSDYIPFLGDKDAPIRAGISMLTAAIFVARSPASAIAVINELRAKGPFVQTVLGVTVVKDFLVIILFSICFSFTQTLIQGVAFNLVSLGILIGELAFSFVLGYFVVGTLLLGVIALRAQRWVKTLLVLALGYATYLLRSFLHDLSVDHLHHAFTIEPLLICILASFIVTNRSRHRVEFVELLENISVPVYVCFFTLTGATLAIDAIPVVYPVALLLFFVRMITMMIGSYVGGSLARDSMKFQHLGWMPYVTQAGVALGLTTLVAAEFPDWGNQFSTVIVSVIVINQFIGPPLFKWSIFQVGEDNIRAQSDTDGSRRALIFGHESQSIALANQLIQNGWTCEIATLKESGTVDEPQGIPVHYINDLSLETMQSLNADRMESIICLLLDNQNLEISEKAYHHFGTPDIIVRLNYRYNSQKFLDLGVKIVEPSTAIVHLLDQFVRSPQTASLLLGMEKGQDSRDIRVSNRNLHGLSLRDLRLPSGVIVLSVRREGQTLISHGYTRLRMNDVVTMVGAVQDLDEVQLRFGG